jgi:hypothetical protein
MSYGKSLFRWITVLSRSRTSARARLKRMPQARTALVLLATLVGIALVDRHTVRLG